MKTGLFKTFKVHMLAFEHGKIREVDVPFKEITGVAGKDLEHIFRWGQNDFQPKPICSVSVGDVVEYDEKLFVFVCLMVGWKEVKSLQELTKNFEPDED